MRSNFYLTLSVLFVVGTGAGLGTAALAAEGDGWSLVRPLTVADAMPTGVPPAEEEAAPRGPLLLLLDKAGVGSALEAARVDVYGHIEVGYTYNFNRPPRSIGGQLVVVQNNLRAFDYIDNLLLLNQLDLNVERRVDSANGKFDVGGRAELLYGTDAAIVHSRGLGEHFGVHDVPQYQFDPLQLYLDLAVPAGNGLRLRLGKFTYFYAVDPNENVFYSHSFPYGLSIVSGGIGGAVPVTLTGGSAEYLVNEHLTVEGGVALGWNTALRDVNQAVDVFGRVSYDLSEKTGLTLRAIVGPEQIHDNADWRLVLEGVVSHRFSDSVSLVINPIFGFQPNVRPDFSTTVNQYTTANGDGVATAPGNDAYWYGSSITTVWKLNSRFSLAGRGEVYRDDGGLTSGFNQWLFETTLGVTITPFPDDRIGSNLKLRPEVRYDYATSRDFLRRNRFSFNSATSHDQFTFGIDAIFNF